MSRTMPRYDMLFSDDVFNGTLLIGPDPFGAHYDQSVFLKARLLLREIGLEMTQTRCGYEEYQKFFRYDHKIIKARIRLVLGKFYEGDLQEFLRKTLEHEDLVYLKTHAGYGKHLSLSENIIYFTDAMKTGFNLPDRIQYQLYYLDCCRSEMYYRDVFRDFVGCKNVDLILNKWFCDYKIVGPVKVLIRELMERSDFATISAKMNDEYGTPHFDLEDDPEDLEMDRKMITYSIGQE